ncbi:hypothetical protein ABDK00_009640 [Niabella insulamsoli]|uniref:hypothetical protein n=1 Tax=Niabella insulamsoli TaxID=3144874 RepID=UPI0031FC70E1
MKKFSILLTGRLDKFKASWEKLSVVSQQKLVLLLFTIYLALTVGIMLKVFIDLLRPDPIIHFKHIENPLIPKEQSTTGANDSI